MESVNIAHEELILKCTKHSIINSCQKIYDATLKGQTNFEISIDKTIESANLILDLTQVNLKKNETPQLNVWMKFNAGLVNRLFLLDLKLSHLSKVEIAKIKFDMLVVFCLLNFDTGPDWKYKEDDKSYFGSEGLAVAIYHMFAGGHFSSSYGRNADALGLSKIKLSDLAEGFHITAGNKMDGIEKRLEIIHELALILEDRTMFPTSRPGDLVASLFTQTLNSIKSEDFIHLINIHFGSLFSGNVKFNEKIQGDIWKYSFDDIDEVIVLHQLPVILLTSIQAALEAAGLKILNSQGLNHIFFNDPRILFDLEILKYKNQDLDFDLIYNEKVIIEYHALKIFIFEKMLGIVSQNALERKLTFNADEIITFGLIPLTQKLYGI